jgi:23S rRNA pseudouridine1911/1915/1917 synthase
MLECGMFPPLYEDDWILAFDKPSALNSAPLPAGGGPDLLSEVLESWPEVTRVPGRRAWEPGLVHRLDRGTSGIVVVARDADTMKELTALQDADAIRKEYLALCARGGPSVPGSRPERGEIGPDGVIRSGFRSFGPRGAGVAALGEGVEGAGRLYETKIMGSAEEGPFVRVRASLTRGHRHQVRVHLAWTGAPIAGDERYGGAPAGRLMLHASSVEFIHPQTGGTLRIECPPPPDFIAPFP